MEDGGSPLLRILLFFIIIMINAVMYGFSAAVQNINQGKVQKKADDGSEDSKKIISIIDNPYKFVNTVQVTSTLLAMLTGVVELNIVMEVLRRYSERIVGSEIHSIIALAILYIIGAIFIIVIILTPGVFLPKRIGAKKAEKWAYALINIVSCIMVLMTPITVLTSALTALVLRIIGIDPNEDDDNVTEEDIVSVVNEGHEQGVLLASEAAMINNIVEFGDKEAKDIMTHRKHLVAVNGNMTLNQVMRFILGENKSRFPVFIDDIDNIVGVLHLKDAAKAYEKPHNKNKKLKDIPNLYRKTLFIPETKKINILFRNMQSEKIHMVVVLDEYGQTSGIVAMEDILEEIVGNILDEYDEDDNNIIKQIDGSLLVKGITPLDDLEKELGIKYDEDDYDTINGFLITKLERIPADDERTEITSGDYKYKILGVENKMISLVQIHKVEKKEELEEKEN